jgi:hypothetical protein
LLGHYTPPARERVLSMKGLLTPRAELTVRRIDEATTAFVGPPDSVSFTTR